MDVVNSFEPLSNVSFRNTIARFLIPDMCSNGFVGDLNVGLAPLREVNGAAFTL